MRVLIVEDHQDSRELLKRCLSRRDFDVTTAETYKPALIFLDKEPFDAHHQRHRSSRRHRLRTHE